VFTCPVCGSKTLSTKPYEVWPAPDDLEISPPYEDFLGTPSYEVCPTCEFEFGNDDNPGTAEPLSFEQDRIEWEERARSGSVVREPEDPNVIHWGRRRK